LSPAKLLHTLEFTAIAIAAVGQAALLISTAICQWRQTQQLSELQDHLHSMDDTLAEAAASGTPTAKTSIRHQHDLQRNQNHIQHQQYAATAPLMPHAAHAGLHLLTGSALVVGLLCSAGLRQLQLRSVVQQSNNYFISSIDSTSDCAAVCLPASASYGALYVTWCRVASHIVLQPNPLHPSCFCPAQFPCNLPCVSYPRSPCRVLNPVATCTKPCPSPLNRRHPLLQGASGLKPSTDAAVRLAALEVATQQTAAQLTNTARQMDKLQARVRLAHFPGVPGPGCGTILSTRLLPTTPCCTFMGSANPDVAKPPFPGGLLTCCQINAPVFRSISTAGQLTCACNSPPAGAPGYLGPEAAHT
jgi:hypothetical protein